MVPVEFTVAICTYNGAARLPAVLEHLKEQVVPEGLQWEVIVVDNNSTDGTASIVEQYAQQWRQDSQIRYAFEATQGTAYARCRAVVEAQSSDLIGFLDDDNLPAATWLAEAYAFGQTHPQAGAYGGIIHPKLDQPPPAYFDQIKSYLTIYHRGLVAFQYERSAKPRRIPAAPGSVIRKQAWQDAVPIADQLLIKGRDEKTMAAGEDAEVMFYIQNSSWQVWHNPKMEVWHHIPPHRLEKAYLLKLARGYGLSNHLVRVARFHQWQRPFIPLLVPFYTLRNSLKLLKFYISHKQKIQSDVAKACEFESHVGQLLSPFLSLYSYFSYRFFSFYILFLYSVFFHI